MFFSEVVMTSTLILPHKTCLLWNFPHTCLHMSVDTLLSINEAPLDLALQGEFTVNTPNLIQ